ncbi:ABC transporter permease [Desulfonatronum thioautotrophicum]|uniref:ABC transporter permease n=1 Tax=Desulfonatronum thioautotrophicum TaxID=617001 RepID=UPI0005EB9974|nr:iron ABC transporter permease [Desulfonatronum thioautotrophicum]
MPAPHPPTMTAPRPPRLTRPRIFREPTSTLTFAALIVIILGLVLYPATSLLIESIRAEDGGWTMARYQLFFSSTYFRHTLYNTLLIAGIAAFLAQILGFFFAYGVVRCAIPGKTIFSAIVLLPMLLPAFLIAFALILLLGRNGLINRGLFQVGEWLQLADPSTLQWVIFGSHGVILAQTLTFFPLAFLVYSAALTAMDPRLEEAARDMGASYWYTLTRVTLPLLAPAAFSSTLLVFMFNVSSFGAPALLSGGRLFFPDATMLAPEAIIQILGMFDWGMGTTIAVILIVPSLLVYFLGEHYLKRRSYITVTGNPSGSSHMPVPKGVQRLVFGVCLAITLFIICILVVILLGAFTRTWGVNYELTLRHFHTALRASSESITNSLVLAVGGALAAATFGTIAAYLYNRRPFPGVNILDFFSMLPYALPGVVMGLGFAVAFGGRIGFLVLTGTWAIIFLNHVIRRMPFALRNAAGALKQIDPALEEAAADLGARPAYNFVRVTLPLLRASFLGAFVFGFINMMTDITAVIFLVSPRWRLLSIDLFNAIDAGRLGVAAALSTIMIASTFLVLALAWKLSGRGLDFFKK